MTETKTEESILTVSKIIMVYGGIIFAPLLILMGVTDIATSTQIITFSGFNGKVASTLSKASSSKYDEFKKLELIL